MQADQLSEVVRKWKVEDKCIVTTTDGRNLVNALVVNLQWPRIPVLYSVQQAVMACLVLPTVLSRFSKCHKITADTTN